ncbi:hypothetical protein ABID42_004603 [Arcicella rosea]|uniref:hypothetical protein n=1 Tax=Arcicella rosea TaxID=502909 RepID=UPI00345D6C9A
MTILRNFDDANIFINLELKRNIQDSSISSCNGLYKLINNELSALFVSDYKLYFILGDEIKPVDDTFNVKIVNGSNGTEKLVKIFNDEVLVFQFSYAPPSTELLNIAPFEYIDEEDFNWGMFIENVINNKNRKRDFIRNLMEVSTI